MQEVFGHAVCTKALIHYQLQHRYSARLRRRRAEHQRCPNREPDSWLRLCPGAGPASPGAGPARRAEEDYRAGNTTHGRRPWPHPGLCLLPCCWFASMSAAPSPAISMLRHSMHKQQRIIYLLYTGIAADAIAEHGQPVLFLKPQLVTYSLVWLLRMYCYYLSAQ